jgi:predicted enzyme related to lactoylglutathione lyase
MSLLINIDVPDLEAAITFYESGLGFRLYRMLFDRSVAELKGSTGHIFLIENASGSNAVPGAPIYRDYAAHWTPIHLDIAVNDLNSAVSTALAAGASASGAVSQHPFGEIARMRDPFGHGFCLIKFSELGYAAVASG